MAGDRGLSGCFSALDVIKRRRQSNPTEHDRETPVVLIVEQDPDVVDATVAEATKSEPTPAVEHPVDEVLDDELLVEEISIDGMCGVY
jgi:mycofactocin precursor